MKTIINKAMGASVALVISLMFTGCAGNKAVATCPKCGRWFDSATHSVTWKARARKPFTMTNDGRVFYHYTCTRCNYELAVQTK